jgi:hypothetical protein
MTPQKTTLQIFKSIAGAVIAGLGMFILYENLAGAVERLRHILVNGSAALGGLRRPSCFFRKTCTRMPSITSGWFTFSFSRCWHRRSGRCSWSSSEQYCREIPSRKTSRGSANVATLNHCG